MSTQSSQSDQPYRAVIYLRTDMPGRDKSQGSIAQQRAVCLQRAAGLGTGTAHEYVDYGPGGNLEERSGLRAMLRDLNTHHDIKYVIAYDGERLARNGYAWHSIKSQIEKAGAELVLAGVDNGQQLVADILSLVQEYLSHEHRQDIKRGIARKRMARSATGTEQVNHA